MERLSRGEVEGMALLCHAWHTNYSLMHSLVFLYICRLVGVCHH